MAPQEPLIHGDNLRKGPWLEEEDEQLVSFISLFGERKWDFIATASGLRRSGKSCRLRWLNYLRPNLKRGQISDEEEQIIIQLHELWGNKWAKIARRLPGRTDNEIKNYWRTHLRKKMQPQEGLNNSKQELLCQEGDTQYSWNFSTEQDYKSVEDINIGTVISSSYSDHHDELSSFTYLNSPYENRLYDWMSSSSSSSSGDHDQNEIMMKLNHNHHHHHHHYDHHTGCSCFGPCFCNYLNFNGEDGGDISILDSVGSLWDMS